MVTPPFVSPLRVGTASASQSGVLVQGALALLFDPTQVSVAYDPNVVSTGDGASVTGALRLTIIDPSVPLPVAGQCTTTDGTTATTLVTSPTLANGKSWIEALVVGVRQSDDKTFVYEAHTLVRNAAGSVTVTTGGVVLSTWGGGEEIDETSSALAVSKISLATGSSVVIVKVTGLSATTIKWYGEVSVKPLPI